MRGKPAAFIALVSMFILGLIAGMTWESTRARHSGGFHHFYVEQKIRFLKHALKLTPEQESAMRDIFDEAHERVIQLHRDVSPDLADIHEDAARAIQALLMPEQWQKFEKLRQTGRHRRMSKEREPGAGTGGNPS
jgi:Spy/CpxP family protein refolding chaperone